MANRHLENRHHSSVKHRKRQEKGRDMLEILGKAPSNSPAKPLLIRRLSSTDSSAFHALRLAGLLEAPSAFGSSYEEERAFSATVIEKRISDQSDRGVFGAFDGSTLVACVGLGRESGMKRRHKGIIWGMYVSPHVRNAGLGKELMLEALTLARSIPALQQINLSVNAENASAIRLYESLGFEIFGREPGALLIDGELHEELHMSLSLE
jgi:RimJ/RimL family protein N-acetyltransferase